VIVEVPTGLLRERETGGVDGGVKGNAVKNAVFGRDD
jgi:hypothetical protein